MDISDSNPSACAPLSLPSPEADSSVSDPASKKLNVHGPLQSIKLDELGPMVVNNDGVCRENRNWNICGDMNKSAHISPSPFRGADMAQ
jgi:hypothetical protein